MFVLVTKYLTIYLMCFVYLFYFIVQTSHIVCTANAEIMEVICDSEVYDSMFC